MKIILQKLIKFYQIVHTPFYSNVCRFNPSCSQYAIEALEIHGVFKGSLLAIARIVRCNPLCKSGYDPVPLPKKSKGDL